MNDIYYCRWFKTFSVFWKLYAFFWVIPLRLNFICRRFGTLSLFHLHRRVEQSVPKRRHIKFRRRGITQKKAYNIYHYVRPAACTVCVWLIVWWVQDVVSCTNHTPTFQELVSEIIQVSPLSRGDVLQFYLIHTWRD